MKNLELKIKNLICLLMILLYSSSAYSQSVDSLVAEAVRNNPMLKSLKAKVKSAEYLSESVGYLPPPVVGVEFSQIPVKDPNPLNKALSQGIFISQEFPLGGKLSAMSKAERKNISIAQKEYDAFLLKLISEIKQKYYEIWMIEHHSELRDETIQLLESLLESTQQLYTVGTAKYSDMLIVKAELADSRTQNEVIEDKLTAAVYEMNALLGRDMNNEDLSVFHTWEIDTLKSGSEELTEQLLNSNPELLRMNEMIEMNELEITSNNRELIPDLMLQGSVMRMPRGMVLTSQTPVHDLDGMGETEYMYSLMASVTLPFMPWSAGKYQNKEEELLTEISGISSEKSDMERRMTAELNVMLERLESAGKQITLYTQEVIPLYRQALEAQLSEYQNSQISINELIATIRMLIMKEEDLAEFQMQHQMILAEIDMITGNTIYNFEAIEEN